MSDLTIRVFKFIPGTLSSEAFQNMEESWTSAAKDVTFSTKNPGGFAECTFRVNCTFEKAVHIYSNYQHYFISIEGGGGGVAWQGRIESVTAEPGQATIVAYGLWSHTFDQFMNDGGLIQEVIAEHPITFLTGYAGFISGVQKFAQSFTFIESRAVNDVQIRIGKFVNLQSGLMNFELRKDTVDGAILATSTMPINSLTAGFNEYVALSTTTRIDPLLTYWILVWPSEEYWSEDVGAAILTGTHNGASDVQYLQDTTRDFLGAGLSYGASIENTTKSYSVTINTMELIYSATAGKVIHYDASGTTFDDRHSPLNLAKDGNTGTQDTIAVFDPVKDLICIAQTTVFGGVHIWPGTLPNNIVSSLIVDYWNGTEWGVVSGLIDGMSKDGKSYAQEGNIQWAAPSDWVSRSFANYEGYWIRMKWPKGFASSLTVAEIQTGSNSRVTFIDMPIGQDWDSGDQYKVISGIGIGYDSTSSYIGGGMSYENQAGAWAAYAGDMMFTVWAQPKYFYETVIGDPGIAGLDTYAKDLIIDVAAACPYINDAVISLDSGRAINPIKFTAQEKMGHAIEKIAAFGSSGDPEPLAVGVWEDGVFSIKKFSEGRRWYVDMNNIPLGQQAFSLTGDLKGIRTHTAVLYSDSVGTRAITPWLESELYYTFGYRREGLYSISGASEAVAEIIAGMVYDKYRRPEQKVSIMIEGHVYDYGGAKWPVWSIRAGDIVTINNILPSGSSYDDDFEERLTELYIQETAYDVQSGRMSLVPTESTTELVDVVLALAGLSGGSMK